MLTGWAVAITGMGLMMGVVAQSVGSALSENAGLQQALGRLGGRGAGATAYLAVTFLMVALLVALIAAGQVNAARTEEAQGRLDHLVNRPVSRNRWLAGRFCVVAVVLVLAGLLAGFSTWAGAASQDAGVGLETLLEAGLNVVPPAVLVLGIGVMTLGLWPRAVSSVTYGLLAWSFLVEFVGGVVNANHWLLDTSVLHHMAAAPAVSPHWASSPILVGVGLVAALLGAAAFSHRDLVGD